jgi:squalene-hopene/tetraprenyl-beta-curcumene cyclase
MVRPQFVAPPTPPDRTPDRSIRAGARRDQPLSADPEASAALDKGSEYLLSLLRPEGYWEGRVYDNVTITAEYVQLLRFLGCLDAESAEKAKKTMLDGQQPDGTWNLFHGGPGDHSATVEAYFSLKICGLPATDPALKKALASIVANGGIESTRVLTKIQMALFGEYPWSRIPVISPELMLLPRQAPIHIYEFSSWSRAVIIPLLIIFARKPVVELSSSEQCPELRVSSTKHAARPEDMKSEGPFDLERILAIAQMALSLYEKFPVKPFRQLALRMAEKWILDHQNPSGSWCGIFPAMADSIIALHLRGYSLDDPILKKGLLRLRSYAEESDKTLRMQSTTSPVWDTGIALYACLTARVGIDPERKERIVSWLLQKQILDVYGDWHVKAPDTRPGGWPFEHENIHYPDIDDTALVLLALLSCLSSEDRAGEDPRLLLAIERGFEWLVGMQGSDGGWGAFDRDNNRQILNEIPFADLKSLLDPSTPDVTGHVLEAFGAAGYDFQSEVIQRGVEFLRKTQEEDGSWFGRWGVNHVYGTGAVLSGLEIVGENMRSGYVQKAGKWLESVQNQDGGWGESCLSYDDARFRRNPSTPSQTAWALIGLLACPGGDRKAIRKGVQYLLARQRPDGGWDEPEWTGTGFPSHFYLRYDYYRLYFPVLALGRYVAHVSSRL